MPVFAYRGLTPGGQSAHGLVDADSARGAWQTLRTRGIYPTTIAPEAGDAAQTLPLAELASATRRLGSLLAAGLPLIEALAAAAELSPATTARALTVVAGRVREGSGLADALGVDGARFPHVYRASVRAGEAGGDLAATLGRLADHLDAALARRRRLAAALTYPAIVTATTLAVVVFLVAWVLPQVRTLVSEAGGRLPWPTRLALAAGDAVAASGWLVLAAVALLGAVLWRAWRRRATARWTPRLAALPVAGPLLRDAAAVRATHALGTLLDAGIALDAALPLAADAAGPLLALTLADVGAQVRDGGTLTQALTRSGAFPSVVVRLVATGERTGTLAASLTQAAALLEADVARRLEAVYERVLGTAERRAA